MTESVAWIAAVGGLVLGGFASFVPGFPGCAVSLLGLLAFSSLTNFTILAPPALVLAALIALAGALSQLAAPIVSSRAAGGSAGAATGAALGASLGVGIPVPGAALVCAILGAAILGTLTSREGFLRTVRGVLGATGGCLVATAADLVAVLALAALLAVASFAHHL